MKGDIEKLLNVKDSVKKSAYDIFSKAQSIIENPNVEISETIWRGVESKNSFSFNLKNDPNDKLGAIIELFGVDRDIIKNAFNDAIEGSGNEGKRITTLHSSSLLALMCFYQVTNRNIRIVINETDCLNCKNVEFEYQNHLYGADESHQPSNIDIALYDGQTPCSSKNVLFLESKFTEPLNGGKVKGISDIVYRQTYNQLECDLSKMGLEISEDVDAGYFSLGYNNRPAPYCGGIKQMISHYLGAITYAANHKEQEVYLGTILYEFEEAKYIEKLNRYKCLYKQLAEALDKLDMTPKNLHMIYKPLTYQEVFGKDGENDFLDHNVKEFYSLGK